MIRTLVLCNKANSLKSLINARSDALSKTNISKVTIDSINGFHNAISDLMNNIQHNQLDLRISNSDISDNSSKSNSKPGSYTQDKLDNKSIKKYIYTN